MKQLNRIRKCAPMLIVCGVLLAGNLQASGYPLASYNWISNPATGHDYAFTIDSGTGEEAEEEAQAVEQGGGAASGLPSRNNQRRPRGCLDRRQV